MTVRILLTTLLLVTGVVQAQTPTVSPTQVPTAPSAPAPVAPAAGFERILLTAGRSTVLSTAFDITRIAVTNPAVADAVVVQPREILIDGKAAGTVSLIIWGAARRVQFDVVVEQGVSTLQQKLQALFPGEDINATVNDEALILSGHVSSTTVMLKAGEIAQASAAKTKVINMLQLPGPPGSQQVMLQVRFAEVNRRATEELGVNLFMGPNGQNDYVARTTTQQFSAPGFDQETTTFSDFLNLFVLNRKYNVGAVIRALQGKGFFQSLAEPNLIAYNGQEASFLAGGEFPVPVVQGLTNSVTIQWKEFGVRLTFTPTIAGDIIRLKVTPEVSSLDFNNGITLQGYRIPALITRRAQTDVELRDGQSFAIAGLLHNTAQEDGSAVPILGSIPIIGALFKSRADRKEQTELMVLITPRLVRPLDPDEVPAVPTSPKVFIKDPVDSGKPGVADAPPVQAATKVIPKKKGPGA
ncbi:MAG: type II and III secretion system protein family protein [Acidobacteria bacterium]|nr:type II and III secretion system protein family protein [Acidobacteriota bacterium]